MGKQYNKLQKRVRRKRYKERVKGKKANRQASA